MLKWLFRHKPAEEGTALSRASSRDVIMRLLNAGADPADADQRIILGLQANGDEALAVVTPRRHWPRSPARPG